MAIADFDSNGRAFPTAEDFENAAAQTAAGKRAAAQFKAEREATEAQIAADIQQQRDFEVAEAAKAHRASYLRAWTGKPEAFDAAYAKVLHAGQVEQMTRQVEGTDAARLQQREQMIALWGSPT